MQTYTNSGAARAGYLMMNLFFLAMGPGAAAYLAWQLTHGVRAASTPLAGWGLVWMLLLVFGGMAALMTSVFVQSLSIYQVDSERIARRGVGGAREMRWREVAQLKESGTVGALGITLTDLSGARLTIDFSLLHDPEGRLRATILERLADLRARQSAEFSGREQVIRMSPAGLTVLWLLAAALLAAAAGAAYSMRHEDAYTRWASTGMLGALAALLCGLARYAGTWRMIFSRQELAVVSCFYTIRIPLHQVDSIFLYDTRVQHGSYQLMMVRGDGKQIMVSSARPEYAALRDALLDIVPREAVRRGEAARAEYREKQSRVAAVIVSVCLVALTALMIWMGTMFLQKEQWIARLARHGSVVAARVTGRACGCDEGDLSDVEYTFTVAGRTYAGENSVRRYPGVRVRLGDTILVRYLPEDPAENRMESMLSTEPQHRSMVFMLAVYGGIVLLAGAALWSRHRQADRPPKAR